MLKLVIVGTIMAAAAADYTYPVNKDMVESIKAATNQWIPAEPHENQFYGWTNDQLSALLGTVLAPPAEGFETVTAVAAPDTWDWRAQS